MVFGKVIRLTMAAAVVGAVAWAGQTPAHARIDTGAAVGIGLGSFALGTAVGAAANPYYSPYYAPYGYAYPAPAYYPPPAPYYSPRSCWDPYYRRYYAC
jgi:hypothetical protein